MRHPDTSLPMAKTLSGEKIKTLMLIDSEFGTFQFQQSSQLSTGNHSFEILI